MWARCRGERGAIVPGSLLVNLSEQQPVTCAPGTGPKLLRRSAAPQDVPGAAADSPMALSCLFVISGLAG